MSSISYTSQELAKIAIQKKSDAKLPLYYDAKQKQNVRITRDFESFLILSTAGLKRNAALWIQKAKALKLSNQERDALLKEVVALDNVDCKSVLDAYNQKLSTFDKFRDEFSADKFVEVIEVAQFLQDLQAATIELTSSRDRAFYAYVFSKLLIERTGKDEETAEKQKQFESWTIPLGAYF